MKSFLKLAIKTVKWCFIVFCVYVGSLFFREERVPGAWVVPLVQRWLPESLVLNVQTVTFGFQRGLGVRGLRLHDVSRGDALTPVVSADEVVVNPFARHVRLERLCFPRLGDGYYREENTDRNARVEAAFPALGRWSLTLNAPDVLSVRPERLTCDVEVTPRRIDFLRGLLTWPDRDRAMDIEAFCYVDLDRQEVRGEAKGLARQAHIRPLLVALDLPCALPYMDAFTDVPEPCPARCAWQVDLVRNDLDLLLDLHPVLGKYNSVSMRRADGKIRIRNGTRGNCLNYETTVGPISAVDAQGRALEGRVVVAGTNGYNVVTVEAKSAQPLADVLKIGGFEGEYVDGDVIGESDCRLVFRFPRSMTNNYEVLNGEGRLSVRGGRLMRLKGFAGLIEAMPSIAPAVTWLSDSTQAFGTYRIVNGVVKTDDVCIEGSCYSIKMSGQFDAVHDTQDFVVTVRFAKQDSVVGKILHPLTWPFSKLLLEFRLTGSPSNPKWSYISVIDRVMEAVK